LERISTASKKTQKRSKTGRIIGGDEFIAKAEQLLKRKLRKNKPESKKQKNN
jgi:nucleoside phosphorylase